MDDNQKFCSKVHRGRWCTRADLAKSVSDAWNNSLSVKTFKNVHDRLRFALVCVVDGKGLNEFVEKWDKFFRDPTLPNDVIGSDQSVEMHGITTTALQVEDLEHDDDIDDL